MLNSSNKVRGKDVLYVKIAVAGTGYVGLVSGYVCRSW